MPVINALCEYKKAERLSIRCAVRCAPQKNAPVVVHIHGGALIGGDHRGYAKALAAALLKEGVSMVSLDYRLAPETKLPEIIADIRDAMDWVRGEGADIFGWDAARVGVTGGSAGGYLTLMTGTFDPKPRALVSYYGYGDILGDWYCKPDPFYCETCETISKEDAFARVGKKERTSGGAGNFYLYTRQTGTWTDYVSGWDVATQREKIVPYCPERVAAADYPPTLLLHGDHDTDVPHGQSAQMHRALTGLGVTSELITLAGFPHGFDYCRARAPETLAANRRAVEFFKEHL